MQARVGLVLLFPLIAAMIACAGSPVRTGWEAEENREKLLGLQIGMSKQQVLRVMGKPRKTEAYVVNGDQLEFWLYLTEGVAAGDLLSDKHLTPLAFANAKLSGWGRNYYDRVLRLKQDITIEQK